MSSGKFLVPTQRCNKRLKIFKLIAFQNMMTMMMKLLLIFIVANGALALKCLECNNMPREYQKSCPGSLPVNYGDTKEVSPDLRIEKSAYFF